MATTARPVAERSPEQIRRFLVVELLSAKTEPEKAVFRCALNLLRGAEAFEIDPVTGLGYTVAAFRQIAPRWAELHAEYDHRDGGDFWQHRIMRDGRAVQARYAAVHPELAEPVWFPDHGPRMCVFCLMEANEAAGLPIETGMDPVTGGIAAVELESAA
jgi:hypothetical protein